MYRFLLVVIMMALTIAPSSAQDKKGSFDFNKDRFLAGSTSVQDKVGVDDLFMFGETVRSEQDITGSAHLFGRKVISTGKVGGDVYIAGMDLSLDGKVDGDVTASGYTVKVGEVAGDLRVSGADITLSGPVSGYALIAGEDVMLKSVVKGDVSLAAEEVDFADGSRIDGTLFIYETKIGKTTIPAKVISEDRIERRDISDWSESGMGSQERSLGSKIVRFLRGVLVITALAALMAAIRPQKLTELRQSILGQPLRNLLFGFLALALSLGAAIIFMFSGLGFLAVIITIVTAFVVAFAGYVVGAYAVGVGILSKANQPEPDSFKAMALAAGAGALLIAIISKIPYLGWLVVLAITVIGAGAIIVRLLRPKLLAPE